MIKRGSLLIFSLALVAAAAAVGISFDRTSAATTGPQILITWRAADSSGPAAYPGKLLPGPNSSVIASVEVLSGGSLLSLSNRTIYWYLDGSFVDGGLGKKTVSFVTPGYPEIMTLRAEVHDLPNGTLMNSIRIQMMNPKMVIVAPYPNKNFYGTGIAVHADPYFFKTAAESTLVYAWLVNGQQVDIQENPQDLSVTLNNNPGPGYPIGVALTAQPSGDPLTTARTSVTLTKAN